MELIELEGKWKMIEDIKMMGLFVIFLLKVKA